MEEVKLICTHDAKFHADDVFAIAILKIIYPNSKVVRTRNRDELEKADMRVDVGGKYNPESGDFDHHHKEFSKKRDNGIPYASAGLVWENYGMQLCNDKRVFGHIDKKLIQPIDANDVGFKIYDFEEVDPYTINKFVSDFNPSWPTENSDLSDKRFFETVEVAKSLINFMIEKCKGIVKAQGMVRDLIKNCDKKYLILDDYLPWKDVLVDESDIQFVVYPEANSDDWRVKAVPLSKDTFENRKNFPSEWAGLSNEELVRVTGVEDAVFCHRNLFIVVAKTKEGAIRLAELAVEA